MKKINTIVLKIVSGSLLALIAIQGAYLLLEPVAVGAVTDQVIVTLTVDAGITISDGAAVTMAPTIGITSNSSIGSSSWTVVTNDADGYTLAVKASTAPALAATAPVTDSFADYTEATPGTPDAWSVPSGSKEFGYSAYGTDVPGATWGAEGGGACGSAGVPNTNLKYDGFTTSDRTIASKNDVTLPTGVVSNICFAAEQDGVLAEAGTYTATITATALVQ